MLLLPVTDQCTFNYNMQMVNYFNQKDGLSEGYTSGSFNSAFGFNGSKQIDAATTKNLSMDGFYIPLAKFQFTKTPLVLQENVKRAIPTSWDPPSLARWEAFASLQVII